MKGIAVNATALGDHPTGLGVYTREIVSGLIVQGRLEGSSVYTGSAQGLRSTSADVRVAVRTSRYKGTKGQIARLVWLQTSFRSSVVRDQARLVYSTVPEGILCLPKGVRQVITVHDIIPIRFPALHRNGVWYYRAVVPLLLRSSAAVVCNSEYTRDDLLRWSGLEGLDVRVVVEGFDADNYTAVAAADESLPQGVEPPYLLWVGDMRPYKNLERVLEAFASVRTPGLSLVVVGQKDARYYPGILETTQRLELSEFVQYLGYVSDRELARLYRHATSLVFASLYEGFGLPPLEAMASGCPVIASNATSVPEVCGEATLYVDPLSTQDITNKMREVISSSALQNQLRIAGLERARLFSWERASGEIGDVLASVSQRVK
jgi:glycosyltransferase involved in cell wall biosynthesis